ncbi:MAG: S8 family peptidase [Bacteroidota bacterium]
MVKDLPYGVAPLLAVCSALVLACWPAYGVYAQVVVPQDVVPQGAQGDVLVLERPAPNVLRAPAVSGQLIVKLRQRVPGKAGATGLASFDQKTQQLSPAGLQPLFPGLASLTAAAAVNQQKQYAVDAITHARDLEQVYALHYNADIAPILAAALLADDPNVVYAEPRYKYPLTGFLASSPDDAPAALKLEPNDPQFSEMSHLSHVNMPQAWDVVKSSEGNVIIGVVDAGTDWRHEDLVGNIWRNPGELENNGVDDDDNGFIDDTRGWNFANSSNDPTGLAQTESNAIHGTLVAGIASAVTNNEEGIAGASWNARLMPVNAGCANTDNAVCFGYEGILYAALEGADIINASWGGPDSFLGREVVRMALDLGVLLVVSAGNGTGITPEGINIDKTPTFPAAYDRVLVVGASGKRQDSKAEFSNFGVGVDVFAPGVTLNSIVPDNGYSTLASGTSFSTPIVAGLAALLKTRNPTWTLDQLRERIRVNSDPIEGSNADSLNGLLGRGRINAARTLNNELRPAIRINDFTVIDQGNDGIIQRGETVALNVEMVNYLAGAQDISFSLSIDDPNVVIQQGLYTIGDLDSDIPVNVPFAFSFLNNVPRDYRLSFRVDIEAVGYQDAALVQLVANRATHDTGVLQMSLTDEGNIGWTGFQDESFGEGFKYLGVNWLFEGGILVGTGPGKISDSVRNTGDNTQDMDFARPEGGFFGILQAETVTENGLVVINDTPATNPLGITIQQESYADLADENNDFIILRYVLSLTDPQATAAIQDVYMGMFTDWDLTRSSDFARFDESRAMGIVQPSATEPVLLLGSKLLSTEYQISYRSINNEEIFDGRSGGDGFTNAEKWAFMSNGVQVTDVDNSDVSTLIAAGPFRLSPGESVDIAFALMAARNGNELASYADRAQTFWEETLSQMPPFPVANEDDEMLLSFDLSLAYPNPTAGATHMAFTIPAAGAVRLDLFDMLGRKVLTLLDKTVPAGRHVVHWNGRNYKDEVVSNGVYFYQIQADTETGHYRATRKVVVVR